MQNKMLNRKRMGIILVSLAVLAGLVAYDIRLAGRFSTVRKNGLITIGITDVPVIFRTTDYMWDEGIIGLTEMGGVVVREDVNARAQRFVATYLATTIARKKPRSDIPTQAFAAISDPVGAVSYLYVKALELNRLRLDAQEFAQRLNSRPR